MEEMGRCVCVCLGCWVHCGAEGSACICLQDYCTVLFSMLVSMLSAVPVFMDECAGTNVCMGACYACSTLPIPLPLVMASVCWTGGEVNCLWVGVCAHVCAGHEAELLPHWGYARYAGCVCVCACVHALACFVLWEALPLTLCACGGVLGSAEQVFLGPLWLFLLPGSLGSLKYSGHLCQTVPGACGGTLVGLWVL